MGIIGIDPSLSCTGYAVGGARRVTTGTIKPGGLRGAERLDFILTTFSNILDRYTPTYAIIEGYALGPAKGRVMDLAELGGLLKLELYRREIPTLVVPPTSLKLFVTGKGNSDKSAVAAALNEYKGAVFRTNDEADAYGLYLLGVYATTPTLHEGEANHHKNRAIAGCGFV